MNTEIRIIIADNKLLMRKGLSALLSADPRFSIVGEASNGKELLSLLKRTWADILLIENSMPLSSGEEVIRVIRSRFPQLKVVILSLYKDLACIKGAIAEGAKGFLCIDSSPQQLVDAILNVHQHGFFLPENISSHLLHDAVFMETRTAAPRTLSRREVEVLKELCGGRTEKEIALKLNISPHTVHFHRVNIYSKTGSHNLADLMRFASEGAFI